MDANEVYAEIRSRILSGVLLPGMELTLGGVSEEFGVSRDAARWCLMSLVTDGYLERPKRDFLVLGMSEQQISEWLSILCFLTQLSVRSSAAECDHEVRAGYVERLKRLIEETIAPYSLDEEQYFLGVVGFVAELLGGPDGELSKLAAATVPACLFRYLWVADIAHGGRGKMVPAISMLIKALDDGDVDAATAAVPYYFDGVEELLRKHNRTLNHAARSGTSSHTHAAREPDLRGRSLPLRAPPPDDALLGSLPQPGTRGLSFVLV